MILSCSVLALSFSASAATATRPCDVLPGMTQPWCNASLSLEQRLADLIGRIPDADIPGLLTSPVGDGGVKSLNILPYQWWNEGLHGIGYSPGVSFTGKTSAATSFPQVITTSMSFNVSLFKAIGSAISTELRAFNNEGHAGLTFWTPNINIFRDPRWGRGQETPGEDPVLTSRYAAEFVRGMQEGEDPAHLKASACLKHFTAYDLESWGGKTRHTFDAKVSALDMVETFDPPFEAGVREGNASCIMCSYNSVNGVPSCANKPFLTKLARDTWGFDGYITSDCGAVLDIIMNHKYTSNLDNTSRVALDAGMDTDCGPFLRFALGHALKDGAVPRSMADTALANLFRVRMRLGQFDPVNTQPYAAYGVDRINSPQHQELALDAARQGIVLLKNHRNVLPFQRSAIKKLAVIGPSSDRRDVLQGNYFGKAPFLVSVAEGLKKYADVVQHDGCWALPEVILDYKSRIEPSVACNHAFFDFAKAEAAAKTADATVIVVGLDMRQEGEGTDRKNLTLPGLQMKLAERVAAVAKGPVILVLMSGGPVDISFARDSDKFAGIFFVGYPGQAGGTAIAESIFGDNNPSGRLTQTFYPVSFLDQWKDSSTSFFDMEMRPNVETGNPGRGYRFYTGAPVFKFGDGLSYTNFSYAVPASLSSGGVLAVKVTNTGAKSGRHTVLAYAQPSDGADVPRSLKQFANVDLAPGASQTVDLAFAPADFWSVDSSGHSACHAGAWKVYVGDQMATTVISCARDVVVV